MVNDTFLGHEIGDVRRYTEYNTVEQYGKERFEREVAAALEHCDMIVWNQYTPYFNDGDACLFSIAECSFIRGEIKPESFQNVYYVPDAISDDPESYEGIEVIRTYEPWVPSTKPSYYTDEKYAEAKKEAADWVPPHESILTVRNNLRHYTNIANKLFGDPTTVVVTKNGVHTFEFEHE